MYQHVRTLGKGAFGLVTLVRSQLTGELAAMKTIDRSKLYTENLKKTSSTRSRSSSASSTRGSSDCTR